MKFGRTYQMTVQLKDGSLAGNTAIIEYPLTLEFDVNRSTLSTASLGFFRIRNIGPDFRKQIYHDRYDTLTYRRVVLTAGYETDPKLPVIFQGNIIQAQSYRQKTDWITEIEAYSGLYGMQNGQVSLSLNSGYDVRKALTDAISTMHNVTVGAIGDFQPAQSERGLALMGNAWEVIQRLASGGEAFIDNEKANVLQKDDYIVSPGTIFELTPENGLLETPRRYDKTFVFNILFEPRIAVGQLIKVTSLETIYNGVYLVKGVRHQGVISGAVGGECKTLIEAWKGDKAGNFSPVNSQ